MRKMFIALAVTALLALILIVGGTAQNQGCLPWKTPVHGRERLLRGRPGTHLLQVSRRPPAGAQGGGRG